VRSFPWRSQPNNESTSGLEPLTSAHYELACGSPEVSYHVLVRDLPKANTRPRWRLPSYCVPTRTNPVAVHTQRTRSGWDLRVTYEFAVGLLRLSWVEPYSQGDPRDPAHPAPVVPDSFRPVRPRERRLRSTSIPVGYLLLWQRRGVGAALSTALEAGIWGSSVSPREAPLTRGRNSHLTQGLPGGLGECQSGDDAGKGGGDEVEGGRDRVARGRQEGGEDQGCRPAEDGDRDAVAQRE